MSTRSDSALLILNAVPDSILLTDADRAYYALLLTQARDKQYIPHTSDSLILTAVNYYDAHGDTHQRALAHFYLASVCRDNNRQPEMMSELLKSQYFADQTDDLRLRALIYYNVGDLYYVNDFFEESRAEYAKMMQTSLALQDTSLLVYSLMGIGEDYFYEDAKINAKRCYDQATTLALAHGYERELTTLYLNYCKLYLSQDEDSLALAFGKKSLAMPYDSRIAMRNLCVGKSYLKLGELDSAIIYFEKAINNEDMGVTACSYANLADIYAAKKNIVQSNYYERLNTGCLDSLNRQKNDVEIQELLHDVKIWKLERGQERKYNYTVICALLLFLIFSVWGARTMRRRKKQQDNLQRKLNVQKRKVSQLKEKHREMIARLDDGCVKMRNICKDIQTYGESRKTMSEEEWEFVCNRMDEKYHGNLHAIQKQYNLSLSEKCLCALLMMDVETKFLSDIFRISRATVYRRIANLTSKFQTESGALALRDFLKNQKNPSNPMF
jgi:tetratricopeptide (TPR) repeat protein